MSLDHVLLGILRTPASGYEIRRQFDEVFSHFWSADLPQIYRTLNRLADTGLLTVKDETSTKGPSRRVYRLTAAGKRALAQWLRTAPTIATERIDYIAQTFFLGALESDQDALVFFRTLRDVLANEHATLNGIATGWAKSDPAYPNVEDRDDFYAQLTLDLGLHKLATKVAWADRCIERIEARITRTESAHVA